jgi:DNA-binding MarR family transcriptional regulator
MTVADLLDILGITKQSLARVLKQLIQSGYIIQKTGPEDRRQRLLYPTQAGRNLILELSRPQSRRIRRAIENAGKTDRDTVARFMRQMADDANVTGHSQMSEGGKENG